MVLVNVGLRYPRDDKSVGFLVMAYDTVTVSDNEFNISDLNFRNTFPLISSQV